MALALARFLGYLDPGQRCVLPAARRGRAAAGGRLPDRDPAVNARHRATRLRIALALVTAISLSVPLRTSAEEPSPGFKAWTAERIANGTSRFFWTALVPEWLKDPMRKVLLNDWADKKNGNWHGIRFEEKTGAKGAVDFSTLSYCSQVRVGWIACARGAGSNHWKVTIRKDVSRPWCQHTTHTPCWDVLRIGIHEASHVGGFLNDNLAAKESYSIMGDPPKGMGARDYVQRCDASRFQLWYGVFSLSGPYADCFESNDHAGPTGRLRTDLTIAATTTGACSGTPVTMSGRLRVQDWGSYGPLGNNPLAGRTIQVLRNGNAYREVTTTAATSGPNWSVDVGYWTNLTASFKYEVKYTPPTGEGLEAAIAAAPVTVTWYRDFDC